MSNFTSAISIALYSPHVLLKESLVNLIHSFEDFVVPIHSNNPDEFLIKLNRADSVPDICLVDVNASSKFGWESVKKIRNLWPTISLSVISELNGEDVVYNLISHKADGYISKGCTPTELKNAMFELYSRGSSFPSAIAKLMLQIARARPRSITGKEQEFLSHCAKDLTLGEIAVTMNVSPRTVDNYRDSLYSKLNIRTRAGLALFAIKAGIAELIST